MAEPPRFSSRELTSILQEAAELEAREDRRELTHADLAQAGAELGLQPESVQRVAARHLARRAAPTVTIDKPFDTSIKLDTGQDHFVLEVPAVRSLKAFRALAGGVVVAAVAAGMTTAAVLNEAYPALLGTVPIVATGVYIAMRGLASLTGIRLELDRTHGRLTRRVGGRPVRLVTEHVRPRLGEAPPARPNEPASQVLALEHGTQTYVLLEGHSEAERRWVKDQLERWLAR